MIIVCSTLPLSALCIRLTATLTAGTRQLIASTLRHPVAIATLVVAIEASHSSSSKLTPTFWCVTCRKWWNMRLEIKWRQWIERSLKHIKRKIKIGWRFESKDFSRWRKSRWMEMQEIISSFNEEFLLIRWSS